MWVIDLGVTLLPATHDQLLAGVNVNTRPRSGPAMICNWWVMKLLS